MRRTTSNSPSPPPPTGDDKGHQANTPEQLAKLKESHPLWSSTTPPARTSSSSFSARKGTWSSSLTTPRKEHLVWVHHLTVHGGGRVNPNIYFIALVGILPIKFNSGQLFQSLELCSTSVEAREPLASKPLLSSRNRTMPRAYVLHVHVVRALKFLSSVFSAATMLDSAMKTMFESRFDTEFLHDCVLHVNIIH